MKDLIKKILREETSGFDPKMLKVLYEYMNSLTKDYRWYHDAPENRINYNYISGSIWLINPKTKKWVLQLEKSGYLWWYWDFYVNFQRYFNMKESDFEKFIKIWVEDVLNRGVSTTPSDLRFPTPRVEDIFNRGVYTTNSYGGDSYDKVEYVLKNGKELK